MKPILFNTEMVRAIVAGRKTVTRRVIKPHNQVKAGRMGYRQGEGLWIDGYGTEAEPSGHIKDYSVSSCWMRKDLYIQECAPYKPGDILYVRETFAKGKIEYWEEPDGRAVPYISQCEGDEGYVPKEYALHHDIGTEGVVWAPSIHMPKEAARIFLRVTNVRAERLQDCGNAQAKDEGCACCSQFVRIWDSTIKPSELGKYGWEANPWVWVVEFERCEKPEEKTLEN